MCVPVTEPGSSRPASHLSSLTILLFTACLLLVFLIHTLKLSTNCSYLDSIWKLQDRSRVHSIWGSYVDLSSIAYSSWHAVCIRHIYTDIIQKWMVRYFCTKYNISKRQLSKAIKLFTSLTIPNSLAWLKSHPDHLYVIGSSKFCPQKDQYYGPFLLQFSVNWGSLKNPSLFTFSQAQSLKSKT